MSILQLPCEIVSIITSFLQAHDICRLYLCGNRMINLKLENGGVEKFSMFETTWRDLEPPAGPHILQIWPFTVKRFSKLKEFHLKLIRASMDQSFRGFISNFDIGTIPTSSLTHLSLCFSLSKPLLLKHLPNSLVYLQLELECAYKSTVSFDCDFPSSLHQLHLADFATDLQKLPSFPYNLTILECCISQDLFAEPNKGELKLINEISRLDSLSSLNVNFLTDSMIPLLPRNIEVLNLHNCMQITAECLVYLPKDIKTLTLPRMDYDYYYSAGLFPPHLTSLKLSSSYFVTRRVFEVLPKKLVELDLGFACDADPSFLALLPRTLRRLSLHSDRLTDDDLQALPPALEQLSLYFNTNFTSGCLRHLPSSLNQLAIRLNDLTSPDPHIYSLLPRALKRLKLLNLKLTDECIQYFPNDLLSLNLFPHRLANDVDEEDGTLLTGSCFSILPKNLRKLVLFASSVNDSNISNLPRDLTYLKIFGQTTFSDTASQLLPRRLVHLTVDNKNLTDEFILNMPKSLTYLNLGTNSNMTDRCIKHLPRALTVFLTDENSNITSTSIPYIPKRCHYYHLDQKETSPDQKAFRVVFWHH